MELSIENNYIPSWISCPQNRRGSGQSRFISCFREVRFKFLNKYRHDSTLLVPKWENCQKSMFYCVTIQFSSDRSLSCVRLFVTPWTTAHQASFSITNSRNLLKLMSIESVMPSSHLILCCPLLFLPPIPPSIRVFSKESALCIRWAKDWSFSFSISPSNEHPGLISFRMDWLDLLAVQWTFKSLLQPYSSKASILYSAFVIVQLSHPDVTTGKTIPLTRRTFVGKVMSLLFNILSNDIRFLFFFSFLIFLAIMCMWDLSSPTRDRTHTPCMGSKEP